MSSDAAHHHHHHNQQLIHNHYEYEFHNHNGFVQSRDHFQHLNECRHEEEMETEMAVLPEAIIRGNMQYVNGEFKKIPRPLNAFMIYSNEKRKELKKEFPGEPNNMISSRLGIAWKELEDETRKKYHDMAHREDLEHRRKFPNYQYSPGNARKQKKARKEQRIRQQSLFRGSRQPKGVKGVDSSGMMLRRKAEAVDQKPPSSSGLAQSGSFRASIKRENVSESYTTLSPSSTAQRPSASQIVHGIAGGDASSSAMPGPYGEGRYASNPLGVVSDGAPECLMSCCNGCKPADIYCCPDSHWNTDPLAGAPGFTPAPYPSPMFYFSPGGFESSFPNDHMMPHPYRVSGDCGGCFPGNTYMDGCYGPMYPTAGDSNMAYKDMCFVPTELPQSTSPGTATPVTSIDSGATMSSDPDIELTDISNNMVASYSQDSHTSSQASMCAGKDSDSVSPSPFQEISPESTITTTGV